MKKCWCIPPKEDARFVSAMEDVLAVYQRAYDPAFPVVCLDEAAKQLLEDVRGPAAMKPGQILRQDNEYLRCGTAALFMAFEPLLGKRWVQVTQRRTAIDFAQVVHQLASVSIS